jgi:hypothetical protein
VEEVHAAQRHGRPEQGMRTIQKPSVFSSVMSLLVPRHAQIEPDRLPRQARDKRKENSPKTSIQQRARLFCVLRVACVLFCQSWRAHWEDNNSIYNNLGTAQRFNLIGRNLFWLILALSILVENLGSSVEHLWCDRQNQNKTKQNKTKQNKTKQIKNKTENKTKTESFR